MTPGNLTESILRRWNELRNAGSTRSMLVGISGIDASGKGFVTAKLADELRRKGLSVAVTNVDGWLNLPRARFGGPDQGRHFYENALRLDEMFEMLILPLRANRSIELEADFAEETASEFRRHRYSFHEIDVILSAAPQVREIYRKVSGSERPADWYPFQVICESCGKIGTTQVSDYDGREVTYTCKPALVTWARGCGHRGKVSPFDGHGKLPWKLEWAAKWNHFGVTIEGAGKDHCTRGGAREVASAVLQQVFGKSPPFNIPYEFFLVGGAKMSSSKGVGVSAKEMAELLPPAVLRFLVLSRRPKEQVNFSPDKQTLFALFDRFDRTRVQAQAGDAAAQVQLAVCGAVWEGTSYLDFQLLVALLQIPTVEVPAEAAKRKGSALTANEAAELSARLASARYWLERYATDDDKMEVQAALPASALTLNERQKGYLHRAAEAVAQVPWTEDALQVALYDAARWTPIPQKEGFQAIYRVFLGKDSGPRAGGLFSVLARDFVIERLRALPYSALALLEETATPEPELLAWFADQRAKIVTIVAMPHHHNVSSEATPHAVSYLDFRIGFANQREEVKRLLLESPLTADPASLSAAAATKITELAQKSGLPFEIGQ